MKTVQLDGARLTQRAEAMEYLARAFDLPGWWGRNLDALYDCLTEIGEPTRVELLDRGALEGARFGRRVLRVLTDAAQENHRLELAEAGTPEGEGSGI